MDADDYLPVLMSWQFLSAVALLGFGIVIALSKKKELRRVAWWTSSAPRGKPTTQVYGALLSLALLVIVWRGKVGDHMAVACAAGKIPATYYEYPGNVRIHVCKLFKPDESSMLQLQMKECGYESREKWWIPPNLEVARCLEGLRDTKFEILGYETDVATSRNLLACGYCIFLTVLVAVFGAGEEPDGALAKVLETRAARVLFLAVLALTVAYILGYTSFPRAISGSMAAIKPTVCLMMIVSSAVVWSRVRRWLALAWLTVCAVLSVICFWAPGLAGPLGVGIISISAVMLELFAEEVGGSSSTRVPRRSLCKRRALCRTK